jgi:hypothetical protein
MAIRIRSLIVKYVAISTVNLAILLSGIAIGVFVAPHLERTARANPTEQASTSPVPQTLPTVTTASQLGLKVTPIQPTMTAGTIGIYLVLAHHVQSDELVVNGFDLVKLHNAELQLLSRLIPPADIQKAVNDSKAGEIFTVASQPASK